MNNNEITEYDFYAELNDYKNATKNIQSLQEKIDKLQAQLDNFKSQRDDDNEIIRNAAILYEWEREIYKKYRTKEDINNYFKLNYNHPYQFKIKEIKEDSIVFNIFEYDYETHNYYLEKEIELSFKALQDPQTYIYNQWQQLQDKEEKEKALYQQLKENNKKLKELNTLLENKDIDINQLIDSLKNNKDLKEKYGENNE